MERPKYSPELARLAAEEIISELIKNQHLDENDRAHCIDDLVSNGRYGDGYDIAKALDDYAHWDCNFEMAEILDGYRYAVHRQIERAEKEWAKATAPQPPHPIGTRVRLRDEAGEITGVYEHGAAKYLVKIDGDPQADGPEGARRIINFEDAVPEAA